MPTRGCATPAHLKHSVIPVQHARTNRTLGSAHGAHSNNAARARVHALVAARRRLRRAQCFAGHRPGDAVTGVLSSNTCGSGLKPTNPWKFEAELSLDGNTLYFKPADQDEVSAPIDSENAATFTSVANSEAATDSACSLSLKSTYTVQLDSNTAPTTGSGSLRFEYSAVRNSTCASQLTENGGKYDELPCAVVFSYTALKK